MGKAKKGFSPASRKMTPCGRTRREFLWVTGGGFAGTARTYLLATHSLFPEATRASASAA